jgi:cell wall-associated NlpC family hydrolase
MCPSPSRRIVVLFSAAAVLGGCGLLGGGSPAPIEDRKPRPAPPVVTAPAPAAPDPRGDVAQALYAHYEQWHGTPYRLGGSTRAGIDCSAFVADTFRTRLALDLPRTTEAQARMGHEIARDELRMGDLVFFKTGLNSRHVGIYLRNGEFMHASRLVGVTISKLRNRYWRAKWWQARRVLD